MVFVVLNAPGPFRLLMAQLTDHANIKLISQLIKSIFKSSAKVSQEFQ